MYHAYIFQFEHISYCYETCLFSNSYIWFCLICCLKKNRESILRGNKQKRRKICRYRIATMAEIHFWYENEQLCTPYYLGDSKTKFCSIVSPLIIALIFQCYNCIIKNAYPPKLHSIHYICNDVCSFETHNSTPYPRIESTYSY